MVIHVNIKRIINDYVECNEFEIKIIGGKVKIYYYDKIEHFSSYKIIVLKDGDKYTIEGKNMIIETMFEEMIVISGNINKITIGKENE